MAYSSIKMWYTQRRCVTVHIEHSSHYTHCNRHGQMVKTTTTKYISGIVFNHPVCKSRLCLNWRESDLIVCAMVCVCVCV